MSDLPCFLDYQSHKLWAPVHKDLPLCPATNRTTTSPSLSFNLMGPKLCVNTSKNEIQKFLIKAGVAIIIDAPKLLPKSFFRYGPNSTFSCFIIGIILVFHLKSL